MSVASIALFVALLSVEEAVTAAALESHLNCKLSNLQCHLCVYETCAINKFTETHLCGRGGGVHPSKSDRSAASHPQPLDNK